VIEILTGRAWKFGDDINTDLLAPGIYMKGSLKELASHCLESVDPLFAGSVKSNDFIVAGRNFGLGSSREQAALVLNYLGLAAVVALSFGGIFYRNAFNCGLPAITCSSVEEIETGHRLEVNLESGTIVNLDTAKKMNGEPIPSLLLGLIDVGGLIPHLEKTLNN